MSVRLKINSAVALLLAGLFCWFFVHSKHAASLGSIIPFADDPYDSIGSFAAIISGPLALLMLFRVLRPYRRNPPSAADIKFLVRTQMAIVLAVLLTVTGDAIAMARHPSRWMAQAGADELLLLMAAMAVLAAGAGYRMRLHANPPRFRWLAVVVPGLSAAVLCLFPETIIRSVPGELLALASGVLVLFASMSALLVALVPDVPSEIKDAPLASRNFPPWIRWAAVALAGAAVGAALLLAEASEGSGIAPIRLVLVSAVFIGAGTTGLVAAYAFLREPLGLSR
jgi:hypothetical protein